MGVERRLSVERPGTHVTLDCTASTRGVTSILHDPVVCDLEAPECAGTTRCSPYSISMGGGT